ncbi:alkaline phosphatase PhoX, partial [Xanthomonas hortorum]
MPIFDPARRQVLKGSAAVMAAGALGSLSALQSRQAQAATSTSPPLQLAPVPSRYGPLAPVADQSTGLPLLQLPRGFSYRSFGWSGDRMDDGQPCPDRHDGMAVVGLRRPDWRPGSDPLRGLEYVLIRNHERGATTPFRAPAMYDTGIVSGTQLAGGGTTTLSYGRRGWGSLEP